MLFPGWRFSIHRHARKQKLAACHDEGHMQEKLQAPWAIPQCFSPREQTIFGQQWPVGERDRCDRQHTVIHCMSSARCWKTETQSRWNDHKRPDRPFLRSRFTQHYLTAESWNPLVSQTQQTEAHQTSGNAESRSRMDVLLPHCYFVCKRCFTIAHLLEI